VSTTDSVADDATRAILAAMRAVIEAAMDVTDTRPETPSPISNQTVNGEALLRLFQSVDAYRAALLLVADDDPGGAS
jgi:hypothetical protein